MAVTITNKGKVVRGNERVRYVDITGPASYTTGGEALSASDLKALTDTDRGVIGDILQFDAESSTGGHTLVLDRTNSKIMYFNGTTQIANATNLSAVTVRAAVVYGIANK
jgi:hypothetical protein